MILGVWAMRPNRNAGPCTLVQGPVMLSEVPEASGLAVSRRDPELIWSHNDSGNETVLFALNSSGVVLGQVRVPIQMHDWEDLSAARCPSGDCLYLADIGDNRLSRPKVQIYRVPEPSPDDEKTPPPEVVTARYADGPRNAEAAFVINGDIFVITRDRTGGLYRSTVPALGATELTLERIATLDLAVVTDAEASPDEKSVVVRTSDEAVFYWTADLLRGNDIPYLRVPIDGLKESQGEGVAVDAHGMLYLASEGRFWSRRGRLLTLRCQLPGVS
ncbi:MAG TPA: hypothetical protein VFR18_11700 [Terriglobia bacterium]|nr:hypothetical protein [Terriglobia bacterium]